VGAYRELKSEFCGCFWSSILRIGEFLIHLEISTCTTAVRIGKRLSFAYCLAMEDNLVTFNPEEGEISLNCARILVDHDDFAGVRIAASFLSKDFEMVIGSALSLITYEESLTEVVDKHCVIVGTIESSRLIQSLIREGKLIVDDIRGRWESFVMAVIDSPLKNVKKSLVIAGSDKRGAIYGIYTLSEQIGVSP
jgi:hypothetical protein